MMGYGAGNRALLRFHHLIFGKGFQAKEAVATICRSKPFFAYTFFTKKTCFKFALPGSQVYIVFFIDHPENIKRY
jgi:hypothetical protein